MASADVIRDVGRTLVRLIEQGVAGFAPLPNVRVVNPDDFSRSLGNQTPVITIFLYRVGLNAALRNGPRRLLATGETSRPLLPLELYYLITPWAQHTDDATRLSGRVLQSMYDHSEVGPAELQGNAWTPEDSVQIVFESLPTEEHYRIWDTAGIPYRLSLAYMVRVVGIEPTGRVATPPVAEAVFAGGAS